MNRERERKREEREGKRERERVMSTWHENEMNVIILISYFPTSPRLMTKQIHKYYLVCRKLSSVSARAPGTLFLGERFKSNLFSG